jgi:NADH-quinone oxidoreductase subunit J
VPWPDLAFLMLAALTLYAAYRVATAPLITHAALFLAVTFAGVAGFFFFLQADFLAAVQLLIYAGAVMAVVVFAIMLSEMRDIGEAPPGELRLLGALRAPLLGYLPLVLSAGMLAVLGVTYLRGAARWPGSPRPAAADSTRLVAHALFHAYVLPFEVASVLLLAALVGAIILTRREEGGR